MSAAAAARGRDVRSLSPLSSPRAVVAVHRSPLARDRFSLNSECRSPRLGAIQEGAARPPLHPPPPLPPPQTRGRRSGSRSPALDAKEEKGAVRSLSPQPRGRRSARRSPPAEARDNGAARSLSPQPRDCNGDYRPPPPDAKEEGARISRYPPRSRENTVPAVAAAAPGAVVVNGHAVNNPPAVGMAAAVNGHTTNYLPAVGMQNGHVRK